MRPTTTVERTRSFTTTLLSIMFLTAMLIGALATAQDYQEAPMLAEMVAAGTLPPVAERLPTNPWVLERDHPAWASVGGTEIGRYGGTIDMAINWFSPNLLNWYGAARGFEGVDEMIGRNMLVRQEPVGGGIEPGLIASWEYSEDGTVLTLNLREGAKWSDGDPFDADDLVYTYVWINQNDALGNNNPWRVGGEVVEMNKIDGSTLELTANGQTMLGFIKTFITWFVMPEHLTGPLTPGYTEGATEEDFNGAGDFGNSATIGPWLPVQADETQVTYERNPYYWKVDAEGNQLPYVDRVVIHQFPDTEVIGLNIASGLLDFASRRVPSDLAVLMTNRERGDYDVVFALNDRVPRIAFNMAHPDDVMREMFHNKLFRQAIQYSIPQERIGEAIWPDLWEANLPSIHPKSPFFDEAAAAAVDFYTFDPERAAALLDEAGYTLGDDGRRKMPDGRNVGFVLDLDGQREPAWVRMLEIWQTELDALGIDLTINSVTGAIMSERRNANQNDATWSFWTNAPFDPVMFNAAEYAPVPFDPGRWSSPLRGGIPDAEEIQGYIEAGVRYPPGWWPPEYEAAGDLLARASSVEISAVEEKMEIYREFQEVYLDAAAFFTLPTGPLPTAVGTDVGNRPAFGDIPVTMIPLDAYVEYLFLTEPQ